MDWNNHMTTTNESIFAEVKELVNTYGIEGAAQHMAGFGQRPDEVEQNKIYIRNILRINQMIELAGSSVEHGWITPSYLLAMACEVMNNIDLDPASCDAAMNYHKKNGVIISKYYTPETNGLAQAWRGNIWLNPPFGRGKQAGVWVDKLISEYEDRKHTQQAIVLVKAAIGYNWFSDLLKKYPICLLYTRPSFIDPYTLEPAKSGRIRHGIALIYMGSHINRFANVFSSEGRVIC